MDEVARDKLASAGSKVRDCLGHLVSAFQKAQVAAHQGGPDFTGRIQRAVDMIENLANDIDEATPPMEAHRSAIKSKTHGFDDKCNDPNCILHRQPEESLVTDKLALSEGELQHRSSAHNHEQE